MASDGGTDQRGATGAPPVRFARTVVVAGALGLFGGLVTVGFLWAFTALREGIWSELPRALDVDGQAWTFIVPVVLVGSVLLGLARARLGEYPVSIEEALAEHQRTGSFDDHHIPQAVLISLISLGFGAALGPEAALTAILGGISSWIARVIAADEREGAEMSYIGITGALGALFGAGAAALAVEPADSDVTAARQGRLWRLIPGLVAAGAGLMIYRWLGPHDHYFDLGLPDAELALVDLAWAVPLAVAGTLVAVVFLAMCALADRMLAPLEGRPVLESVVGGLGLAALASWSSLVLFSGHEGVDTLVASFGGDSAGFLVAVALAKMAAAALLLSAKWKGGRFFPLMFAGAAVGLAAAVQFESIGEVLGIAAAMTAAVGVLLRRPLITLVFMVFFFPVGVWPVVVIAALIGSMVGKEVGKRTEPEPSEAAEVGS